MENNFSNQSNTEGINSTQQSTSTVAIPFVQKRFLVPTTFGVIVLMFFFTFIDIKCNNVSLGTVKGYELATGYSIQHKGEDSSDKTHERKPNIFALGALFLAVLGFGLGFLKSTPGSISKIFCGFMGFLMMTLLYLDLKSSVKKSMSESGGGLWADSIKLSVEFQMAFWLALLLFIGAGILGVVQLVTRKKG